MHSPTGGGDSSASRRRGQFDLKVQVKEVELLDPDAGEISMLVIVGGEGFLSAQEGRSQGGGKKLVTP